MEGFERVLRSYFSLCPLSSLVALPRASMATFLQHFPCMNPNLSNAFPSTLSIIFSHSATQTNPYSSNASLSIRTLGFRSRDSIFSHGSIRISNPNFPSFHVRSYRRRSLVRARATGPDYYATLNVGRTATLQEIKSSYRNLARKVRLRCWHWHVMRDMNRILDIDFSYRLIRSIWCDSLLIVMTGSFG